MSETPLPLPLMIDSPELWNRFADMHNVQGLTIYQLEHYNSASKIGDSQYLALRALWSTERRDRFHPQEWGLRDVGTALEKLRGVPRWNDFLKKVGALAPVSTILPTPDLGIFTLIWYYQQAIMWIEGSSDSEDNVCFSPPSSRTRFKLAGQEDVFQQTPTRTRMSSLTQRFMDISLQESPHDMQEKDEEPADNWATDPDYRDEEDAYPPVSDENIVNNYLVSFASATTILIDGVKAHWSAERKAYKVGRRDGGKFIKLYEARTDGHLFIPNNEKTDLILEVKPMMRESLHRVRMQETAQMAAWIHAERDNYDDNVPTKCRFQRILLSQNRHEIYLIIATYDTDYVEYLTNPNRNSKHGPFLKMNEYGPWDIGNRDHVEHIASIILCITLQVSRGIKTS